MTTMMTRIRRRAYPRRRRRWALCFCYEPRIAIYLSCKNKKKLDSCCRLTVRVLIVAGFGLIGQLQRRMKTAELKQQCMKPDVVEVIILNQQLRRQSVSTMVCLMFWWCVCNYCCSLRIEALFLLVGFLLTLHFLHVCSWFLPLESFTCFAIIDSTWIC